MKYKATFDRVTKYRAKRMKEQADKYCATTSIKDDTISIETYDLDVYTKLVHFAGLIQIFLKRD